MIARPGASLLERWDALGRPLRHLPRWAAALVLALLGAALTWSLTGSPQPERGVPAAIPAPVRTVSETNASPARNKGDMALYARIAARMAAGEGYYAAALGEHRASGYPTRPFVTVRLPTLALVQQTVGLKGVQALAMLITSTAIIALNWRAAPVGDVPVRILASAMLAAGGGAALSPVAGYDHDFIAGLLLTLALLAYRPGCSWPALLAAGAALAVRELAAPFVVLWLGFALAAKRWREVAGVAGILAVFAGGVAAHAGAVDAARLPGDLVSQGWAGLAGYGLPIAALGELTGLRFLPAWLAAPLAVLPLIGWLGRGGRLGLFATLWFAGIATMMALFARPANYYWAELAQPAYMLGLAFAPQALRDLWHAVARQT